MKRFQRRGGRPQEQSRLCLLGPDHGHIPGMVLQFLFLFVRWVMLFIHDNDSHIFKGGEDGRPSPHGNLYLSFPDSPPLIITFSPSKPTVKESKVFSKPILK